MAVTTLAAFWAVSVLFVLTPGADWAYAIAAGASASGAAGESSALRNPVSRITCASTAEPCSFR